MKKELIYLACPYTHPDRNIRRLRSVAATTAAARLAALGHAVFSPITHGHPIVAAADLLGLKVGHDWEAWQRLDEPMIWAADKVMVLKLAGWRESVGVQAEIALAESLGKPVEYLEPVVLGEVEA